MEVECSKDALKLLHTAGLEKTLDTTRQTWHRAATSLYPHTEDGFTDAVEKAEGFFNSGGPLTAPTEQTTLYRQILAFFDECDDEAMPSSERQELWLKYPLVMPYIALGDRVLRYKELGFQSLGHLAESVTGFCLGDQPFCAREGTYRWVHGSYKNSISNEWHGDLHVIQTDISIPDTQQYLFNAAEFTGLVRLDPGKIRTMFAPDTYWDMFLMSLLRYAEATGRKEMPEIKDWQDVLRETGYVPTHKAEAELGTDFALWHVQGELLIEGRKMQEHPIFIADDSHNFHYPYLKDGKLLFMKPDEQGGIESIQPEWGMFKDMKFRANLIYEPEELPQLLRATYKLFARDRRRLPAIMDVFVNDRFRRDGAAGE